MYFTKSRTIFLILAITMIFMLLAPSTVYAINQNNDFDEGNDINIKLNNESNYLSTDNEVIPLADQTIEMLDGDYAYLSSVSMDTNGGKNAIITGTAPWDTNDNPGNDSSSENNIVRTFDTVTYSITMTTHTYDTSVNYKSGKLYFEFVVEGNQSQVQWELGSMGWLDAKNGTYSVTEEDYEGTVYQILRGYIILTPDSDDNHTIGETTQTLSIALRILSMKNEDEIIPAFTFFLDYNDVGLTEDEYELWGTGQYSGTIVTFDGQICEKHDDYEYQTVYPSPVIVSAVQRYNLLLKTSTESKTQLVSTYDFDTGNSLATEKGLGKIYGRLGGYGLALQICGKDSNNGLRGVEIPENGEKISASFTLALSSTYTSGTKTYEMGSVASDGTDLTAYAPLIWSFDENNDGSTQQDGRTIPVSTKYAPLVPYNKYKSSYWYCSCEDGGSWAIQKNSDGTYTVSVTDCVVNMDQLPYVYPGAGTSLSYEYYNPNNINYDPSDDTKNDYWEVPVACLSTAELWVVQPYYDGEKDDGGTGSSYIAQVLGEGTYNVTLEDSNLEVTDSEGNILLDKSEAQSKTTDDHASQSMALVNPGSIDQHIAYVKYNYSAYNDSLIDGCFSDGKDWILQGDKLTIETYVTHDSAEEGNTGVAYDVMIKFDDAFFEPESISHSGLLNGETRTDLWAAKPDGSGWDHTDGSGNILSPDDSGYDTEMINATPDDLVYYSSLSALESSGAICIGVLVQYRGLMTEQQNHIHTYIKGTTKVDTEVGYVYMTTPYCRAWDRNDLAQAMADDETSGYTSQSEALTALLTMTTDEVKTEVNKYIPTKTGSGSNDYIYEDDNGDMVDYPSTYWINGDNRHPDTSSGGSSRTPTILNYKKTYYDSTGTHEGTSGNYYGDSCLLVGYESKLAIKVATQTATQGEIHEKSTFDIDAGQNVVDYVINPSITRTQGESTSDNVIYDDAVVVTVTLPANLTYISGSSYIGGNYETSQEGKQGTVSDGVSLQENVETTFEYELDGVTYTVGVLFTVTTNTDGTQTLTYTFTNVPVSGNMTQQFLESIYFSCEIDSNAVKNGEQLDISASISCEGDKNVDTSLRTDSKSVVGITISKNAALSLTKKADQTFAELDEECGFNIKIGNNSNNSTSIVAIDNLPYYSDNNGSTITNDECKVYITEFSAYDTNSKKNLDGFFYFYSDNPDTADVRSDDFHDGDYFVTGLGTTSVQINDECIKDGWKSVEMEKTETSDGTLYTALNIPDDIQIYDIVAVGTLGGLEAIDLHVTVKLTDAEPGDQIINQVTQQYSYMDNESVIYEDLIDTARTTFISRTISGTVWLDEDIDGGINTGKYNTEELLGGVKVTLQMLDNGEWKTANSLKADSTGLTECITTTDENGYYEFNYLTEGTYRVFFEGTGTGNISKLTYNLSDHDITTLEATGIETSLNSKAVLSNTNILSLEFELPSKNLTSKFSGSDNYVYKLNYINAGIMKAIGVNIIKEWENNNESDFSDIIPDSVTFIFNFDGIEKVVNLNSDNSWKETITGFSYYDGIGNRRFYSTDDITEFTEIGSPDTYELSSVSLTYTEQDGYVLKAINTQENPTYGIGINKVNRNNEKLIGATFTLTNIDGETLLFNTESDTSETYDMVYTVSEEGTIDTITAGNVYINGLSDGIYTLTEITAPAGYTKLTKNITITITEDDITINNMDNVSIDIDNDIITIINIPLFTLPQAGSSMFWLWITMLSLTFGFIISITLYRIHFISIERKKNKG